VTLDEVYYGELTDSTLQELPRIAVSVGMLNTGFECPELVNIVFCRLTGSVILHKQIRGRGRRLCDSPPKLTPLSGTRGSRS